MITKYEQDNLVSINIFEGKEIKFTKTDIDHIEYAY